MKKQFINIFILLCLFIFLSACKGGLPEANPQNTGMISQNSAQVEEDGLSANYYYLKSRFYYNDQDYAKAIQYLQKALEQDPKSYTLARELVILYLHNQDMENALATAEKLIKVKPNHVETGILLLELKKENMSEEEIMNELDKLSALDPENTEAFLRIGKWYLESKEYIKAGRLFEKMMKQFPDYYMPYYYLGIINMHLENFDIARAELEKVTQLKPDLLDPRFRLIECLNREKDPENSRQIPAYYREILDIDPHNKQAKLGLSFYFYQNKEKETNKDIVKSLEKDIDEYLKEIDIVIGLASLYEKRKNTDQTLNILEKALEHSPDNTYLLFTLGAAQDRAGFKEKCLANMRRIIEINPDDASALNYIGYTYADDGIHLNEALAMIKKAYKLKPDDGNIVDSLGWVYYRMEEYNKAVEFLEKAVEMTESSAIIIDHLGDAYQKTDQYRQALDAYEKALEHAGEEDAELVDRIKQKIIKIQQRKTL